MQKLKKNLLSATSIATTANKGLKASTIPIQSIRLFSNSNNQDNSSGFEKQVQDTVLGLGMQAGEQAIEVAKAFRELYVDDDRDGDDEELIAQPKNKDGQSATS